MSDPRPPDERARLEQTAATAPSPATPRSVAWRHYLWVAGAALVVLLALHWLGPVLTPFLVGAIFAYLGKPLVDRLERRRVPRSLGALVVILIFGVAVTALFLVLIPLIQAEVTTASRKLMLGLPANAQPSASIVFMRSSCVASTPEQWSNAAISHAGCSASPPANGRWPGPMPPPR